MGKLYYLLLIYILYVLIKCLQFYSQNKEFCNHEIFLLQKLITKLSLIPGINNFEIILQKLFGEFY